MNKEHHIAQDSCCDGCSADKVHGSGHETGNNNLEILKLALGAAIFTLGIAISHFFETSPYISTAIFIASYLILGGEIVWRAIKNIAQGQFFDENFLMAFATLAAFAIGQHHEAVAVMLFYQVGEYFQKLAVKKSKKSITELMDIRPDCANLKKGDEIVKVAPETVEIGEAILVKPGEKIPLDGIVLSGESMLNASALTGESVPKKAKAGDFVMSGCINQNGALTIKVTKTFGESTASKILELVEHAAEKKAPTQNFITKFSRYYTPAVVGLALLIAVMPPLIFGGEWLEWINRGLIFLVISCPCALVISIPLGFFGGIGGASKKGILVKGGNYLEALNNLEIVVFDKTGTLTKGNFEVTGVVPSEDFTDGELLNFAAAAETYSSHPIAAAIAKAHKGEIDRAELSEHNEIAGRGVGARYKGKSILAGNDKLMEEMKIPYDKPEGIETIVHIAADNQYAGHIKISDEIKPDSQKAIAGLKAKGLKKTVMLTGDRAQIAEATAKKLGIDEYFGGLLPGDKVEKLEELGKTKRPKGKLAFVGDGINDAPVLARADIGIAMGALGSDAAIEAADVVLMTDEPSKLLEAIDVARFTKRIVWQNIIFALGVKGIFLLLGALGMASMWEAVFADVGVALLAVLNAMRVAKI